MIPVALAKEPSDFDATVRQKGLRALAELVGEKFEHANGSKRRGKAFTKIANTRAQIPSEKMPAYWVAALPDMLASYHRLCAYLALYLEHATGNPSVDHMQPKSRAWDKAYEWNNYRLASSFINAKKGNLELALDPFTISSGTFALEFVAFQVKPGPAAKGALAAQAQASIEMLGLNRKPCCDAREEYVDNYLKGDITLCYLERRAPFVAQELRRQELLLATDK